MEAKVKVDAGICGFKTVIKASTEDSMNVELKVETTIVGGEIVYRRS